MERQESGFKKITESYHAVHNYRKELKPELYSDAASFQVTLYNLNYGTTTNTTNVTIEDENVAITTDYIAIDGSNASQTTIKKAKEVYKNMGTNLPLVVPTFPLLQEIPLPLPAILSAN